MLVDKTEAACTSTAVAPEVLAGLPEIPPARKALVPVNEKLNAKKKLVGLYRADSSSSGYRTRAVKRSADVCRLREVPPSANAPNMMRLNPPPVPDIAESTPDMLRDSVKRLEEAKAEAEKVSAFGGKEASTICTRTELVLASRQVTTGPGPPTSAAVPPSDLRGDALRRPSRTSTRISCCGRSPAWKR